MKKLAILAFATLFLSACESTTEEIIEETTESLLEEAQEETLEEVIDFTIDDEIKKTDGLSHSVPLEDILAGGPPKDGIPPIDDPEFVSIEEAREFLRDAETGIMVEFDGVTRFYSFQILVWHEIVNDQIGDQSVLVTYCPLCGSGIVFDPIVNGVATEFGTSGKLWNSNLVMYDRQTDSYWSQILGEAIVGEMTGTRLDLLPSQIMTWATYQELYPNGEVLSTNTGYSRDYTQAPYGDYAEEISLFFPVDHTDDSFHPKTPSYGIEIDGVYKAYIQEYLEDGSFEDEVNGVLLELTYDSETQNFSIINKESGEEVIPFYNFWFSWFAVHPETLVSPELD